MLVRTMYLVIWLTATPLTALAGASPYSCRIDPISSTDITFHGTDTHSITPGSALEVCEISSTPEKTTYAIISPVTRGKHGVCQFTRRQIFNEDGKWTHEPPGGKSYLAAQSIFMSVPDGECPSRDYYHYTATNNVTGDVFLAAERLWAQISAARKFDDLLNRISPESRSSDSFQRFRDAMTSPHKSSLIFELVGVSRLDSNLASDLGLRSTAPYYTLSIRGAENAWSVIVDFDEGRMHILGVGEIEY